MSGGLDGIRAQVRAAAEPARVPQLARVLRPADGDVLLGVRVPRCSCSFRRHVRGDADERAWVVAAYLSHTDRVDGWDLVDASAPGVLGAHLLRDAAGRDVLDVLAGSSSVWERRIAVVATLALVRAGEPEDTLRLALALAGDEHDLVRKAVGWTLHEVGRHDAPRLAAFLAEHGAALPAGVRRRAARPAPSASGRSRARTGDPHGVSVML